MTRSTLLAAAIAAAGLTAFLLLVSGAVRMSWSAYAATGQESVEMAATVEEAAAVVTLEEGTFIAYEEATYISHDRR